MGDIKTQSDRCTPTDSIHHLGGWQGRSQPHSPGWARVPLSSFFPQILINFSYFSSNFLHFLPHFDTPGGRLAHPGRPWLRHWWLNSEKVHANAGTLNFTQPRYESSSCTWPPKCGRRGVARGGLGGGGLDPNEMKLWPGVYGESPIWVPVRPPLPELPLPPLHFGCNSKMARV